MFRKTIEGDKRCWLGRVCSGAYDKDRCDFHAWTYRHNEAVFGLTMLVIGIIALSGVITLISWNNDVYVSPAYLMIDGLNCASLSEYIADQSSYWSYAEHRYKWLCLADKSQIFDGG